jgi:hypothetical protein
MSFTFYVNESVHRTYVPICIQQDASLHSLFTSTCFGWYIHPSSGAHTTVSTASGICHAVTATYCYSGGVGTTFYMFKRYLHSSSGAYTTVSTASGIFHTVTAICRYRGRVGNGLSVLWVAYDTHSTLKPVPTLPR